MSDATLRPAVATPSGTTDLACRVCAAPWPCASARLALMREFADDRVGLCLYLATVLQDALPDLLAISPEPDPQAILARFLAWAPPRRRT